MASTTHPSLPLERDRPKPAHALKPRGAEQPETDDARDGGGRRLDEQVSDDTTADDGSGAAPDKKAQRRWIGSGVAAAVAVLAAVGYYFYSRGYESTDDAFIDGHVVQVSPRVPGHVMKVHVIDNQWVNEGDPLVDLDPADYEARVAAAQAALAAAEASYESRSLVAKVAGITFPAGEQEASAAVDGANAKVETARAAVATAESSLAAAKSQVTAAQAAVKQSQAELPAAKARQERAAAFLNRIRVLVPEHAAAKDTLDEAVSAEHVASADVAAKEQAIEARQAALKQAEAGVVAAESGVRQAKSDVIAQLAAIERAKAQLAAAKSAPQQVAQSRSQSDVAAADIKHAQAELDQAKLNLSYTKIRAPFSGHVTRKSVEAGAYVQTGQPLMAIVEKNLWVTANFKETQLDRMHPGQKVRVTVDAHPGVEFDAHVESIQRGSGAWFSLLPPENATGNFVKVVQRVPVKIVFDDLSQVDKYALGPGMSVAPTVKLTEPEPSNVTAGR